MCRSHMSRYTARIVLNEHGENSSTLLSMALAILRGKGRSHFFARKVLEVLASVTSSPFPDVVVEEHPPDLGSSKSLDQGLKFIRRELFQVLQNDLRQLRQKEGIGGAERCGDGHNVGQILVTELLQEAMDRSA